MRSETDNLKYKEIDKKEPSEQQSKADEFKKAKEWNAKGARFFENENYPKAIECVNEAINLSPGLLFFFGNRSLYYLRSCQFDLALKDAERWMEKNPTEGQHFSRLGACLMGLERYEEADAMFNHAIKVDPLHEREFWIYRNLWLQVAHERALKSKECEKNNNQGTSEQRGFLNTFYNFFSRWASSSETGGPAPAGKVDCDETSSPSDLDLHSYGNILKNRHVANASQVAR